MNEEVRRLIRFVCDGNIRDAQAQTKLILKHTTTQKDAKFVKDRLKQLEDSEARFITLPYNLQGILSAEDSQFFPVSRFLLRPEEEKIVDQILKIRDTAAILKDMFISYTPTLMLYGDSGTGKTMLARYIAYRAGVPYLYIRFSGLMNSYLGKTQENLNRIFAYAKKQPCVLCIDEIDTIGMRRGQDSDVGEMNRIVISLMQEMDQLPNDMIMVATTNRFDQLDSAMVRRFTITREIFPYTFADACTLLRKFFDFADLAMTDEQIQQWVRERFRENIYYPNALIKDATQYLVDNIIQNTPAIQEKEEEGKEALKVDAIRPIYVLYEETPEVLGSGSVSREVFKTGNLEKALLLLKEGKGNVLVKRIREEGNLKELYWNSAKYRFE